MPRNVEHAPAPRATIVAAICVTSIRRAPVPRVGDDAADHREDDDRHDADQADQAERQPLAFRRHEQRHVPQQRRVLHHRAGERDEQPDPDQPEVAVLERDE